MFAMMFASMAPACVANSFVAEGLSRKMDGLLDSSLQQGHFQIIPPPEPF
jgi:hypothetical protein